jgi:hypothetical protein
MDEPRAPPAGGGNSAVTVLLPAIALVLELIAAWLGRIILLLFFAAIVAAETSLRNYTQTTGTAKSPQLATWGGDLDRRPER